MWERLSKVGWLLGGCQVLSSRRAANGCCVGGTGQAGLAACRVGEGAACSSECRAWWVLELTLAAASSFLSVLCPSAFHAMPQSAELLNITPQGQWAQSTGHRSLALPWVRVLSCVICSYEWSYECHMHYCCCGEEMPNLETSREMSPSNFKTARLAKGFRAGANQKWLHGLRCWASEPGTFFASAENSVLDPSIFIKLCHAAISCLLISGTAWSWNKIHEAVWVFCLCFACWLTASETVCCRHISEYCWDNNTYKVDQ